MTDRAVEKCRNCGYDNYQIKMLYHGYRQSLFIAECPSCRDEIVPVIVEYGTPDAEMYSACNSKWNDAMLAERAK